MKSKKIQQDSGGKTFVLVFSPGDQVPSQLVEFARRSASMPAASPASVVSLRSRWATSNSAEKTTSASKSMSR